MKPISFSLIIAALLCFSAARGQDAATEERLNRITGQIEDLIAGQKAQQKQISELMREVEALREASSKPTGNFAAQEDVKHLAEAIKEVDRKRLDDSEKTRTELLNLRKVLETPVVAKRPSAAEKPKEKEGSSGEKGFDYVIKSGDTLSVIVQAYAKENIKVTTDQIVKANPGLNPNKLRPGQKIWIPAPQS
jgi:nucleoid-associated protein YgaU